MECLFYLNQLNVCMNKNNNKNFVENYKNQVSKCQNCENYEKHKSFVIMSTENDLPSPKKQREMIELK